MENKISNLITGFRKSHETQHSLIVILGNQNKSYISVIFMDLSKIFDTINHNLLLPKLKAFGFSRNALDLIYSYLKNRRQRVVINNKISSTETVMAGVARGSIDEPLLLNLFIN